MDRDETIVRSVHEIAVHVVKQRRKILVQQVGFEILWKIEQDKQKELMLKNNCRDLTKISRKRVP